MAVDPGTLLRNALTAAQRSAALVSYFDPRAILPAKLRNETRRAALSHLADDSEEVQQGQQVFWQLKPDARLRILADMVAAGGVKASDLARLVKGAGPVVDQFGDFLRKALTGSPPSAAELDTNALSDLNTALEFANAAGAANADPTAARSELGRRSASEALESVIPEKLIGRRDAYQVIADFVETGIVSQPYGRPDAATQPAPPILVITGVGGAGKSALVAQFALDRRGKSWNGTPVVVLDFDRQTLAAAAPVDLMLEFTRQLGWARPALAEGLSGIRATLRQKAAGLSTSETDNLVRRYEYHASANTAAFEALHGLIASTELRDQPVLIILDTVEEVLNQGSFVLDHMFRWLRALVDEAGLAKLRVIMSGRAAPEDVSPQYLSRTAGHLPVGELDRTSSIEMLATHGLRSQGLASRLFDAFGGNPLVLKILAAYLAGKSAAQIETFLGTEAEKEQFRGELAQRWLYSRTLERIDDKELRKLAFPGLVLRRVTPDLVREVLAVPCGLRDIDQRAAERLFGRLAAQVWLIKLESADAHGNPIAVQHRRDVRRLMMIGIGDTLSARGSDNAPQMEVAADRQAMLRNVDAIHQAARDYYKAGRDPALDPTEQRREWLYHALMLNDASVLREDGAADLVRGLGEDITFLPIGARAAAKRLIGRTLTPEEQSSLGAAEQAELEQERLESAVSSGATSEALADTTARSKKKTPRSARRKSAPASSRRRASQGSSDSSPRPPAARRDLPPASWIEAEFAACRFDSVGDLFVDLMNDVRDVRRKSRFDLARWKGDFSEHPLWLAVVARLTKDDPLPADLSPLTSEWGEPLLSPPDSSRGREIATLLASTLLLLGVYSDPQGQSRMELASSEFIGSLRSLESRSKVRSLIGLRCLALMGRRAPMSVRLLKTLSVSGGYLSFLSELFLDRVRDTGSKSRGQSLLALETTKRLRIALSGLLGEGLSRLSRVEDATLEISRLAFEFDISKSDPYRRGLSTALRGISSELYAPARTCFAEALTTYADRQALVEAVWQDLPVRPDRLEPKVFAKLAGSDPHRWFTKLIEFVDCCGRFEALMHAAYDIEPNHPGLRDLNRLFDRFDAALLGPSTESKES
jgi:hypothetical protein